MIIEQRETDDPDVLEMESRMQMGYVEMYGEPDQDPDNHVSTAEEVLVAVLEGQTVGLLGWGRWPDGDGKVKLVWTDPDYRGKGVAQALLTTVEDRMRAAGIPMVRFESGPKQQPAHNLYYKNGYAKLDEGFGYYADQPDSTFFGKVLK